jgi:steroid delta-isomerase-like uncharacterized protein
MSATSPTPPTPDSVVRTWFEDLWNQGREETIERFFAVDGIAHGLGSESAPLRGPDGYRPFFRTFRNAFPDIRVEVLRTTTEGEMVTAHCRVTGTHSGNTMGIATGKRVDFYGMTMVRVRNGKIVEAWNNFDFLSFYQQIGMLPQLPV